MILPVIFPFLAYIAGSYRGSMLRKRRIDEFVKYVEECEAKSSPIELDVCEFRPYMFQRAELESDEQHQHYWMRLLVSTYLNHEFKSKHQMEIVYQASMNIIYQFNQQVDQYIEVHKDGMKLSQMLKNYEHDIAVFDDSSSEEEEDDENDDEEEEKKEGEEEDGDEYMTVESGDKEGEEEGEPNDESSDNKN
jgi:hypothetical protein